MIGVPPLKPVLSDLPIVTMRKSRPLWAVKCAVTGKKIPALTTARRRWVENSGIHGEVISEFSWISEEGYTYLQLTKQPGEVFYE